MNTRSAPRGASILGFSLVAGLGLASCSLLIPLDERKGTGGTTSSTTTDTGSGGSPGMCPNGTLGDEGNCGACGRACQVDTAGNPLSCYVGICDSETLGALNFGELPSSIVLGEQLGKTDVYFTAFSSTQHSVGHVLIQPNPTAEYLIPSKVPAEIDSLHAAGGKVYFADSDGSPDTATVSSVSFASPGTPVSACAMSAPTCTFPVSRVNHVVLIQLGQDQPIARLRFDDAEIDLIDTATGVSVPLFPKGSEETTRPWQGLRFAPTNQYYWSTMKQGGKVYRLDGNASTLSAKVMYSGTLPAGLSADADFIYVADCGARTIARFDSAGGNGSVVVSQGITGAPVAVAVDGGAGGTGYVYWIELPDTGFCENIMLTTPEPMPSRLMRAPKDGSSGPIVLDTFEAGFDVAVRGGDPYVYYTVFEGGNGSLRRIAK